MSILCQQFGYAFMADDLSIVDQAGKVYSYPKPVTIDPRMLRDRGRSLRFRERLSQSGQRLLYTRFARRFGLWLSAKDLPAATLNTYLQWLVPQPKDMINEIVTGIEYGDLANCALIINANAKNAVGSEDLVEKMIDSLQLGIVGAGFQPHPLLAERFRYWQDVDLMEKERAIIKQVVESSAIHWFEEGGSDWWFELAKTVYENDPSTEKIAAVKSLGHDIPIASAAEGEPRPL
jgi:hypothetical protein